MDRSRLSLMILMLAAFSSSIASADALRYRVDASYFSAVAPALAADGVTPVLDFKPVNDGALPDTYSATSQSFVLGSFVITPPTLGETRTFSDQRFHLEVRVPELDAYSGPDSSGWWNSDRNVFMVEGSIKGQVVGGGTSALTMNVDKLELGSFGPFIPEEHRTFHFPIDLSRIGIDPLSMILAPTSTSGTYSLIVNVQPVPEPVALVPLGLLALWLLRKQNLVADQGVKG